MAKNPQPSADNTKKLIQKVQLHFNQLPDSYIQPLLIGIFLLGIASTFFSPGVVICMAGVFGISAGMSYAAAVTGSIPSSIPNWVLSSIGVGVALIYGIAGMPGLFLTTGLIGGWYLNANFSHRYNDWKKTLVDEINEFRAHPLKSTSRLLYKILELIVDFLTYDQKNTQPNPATTPGSAAENTSATSSETRTLQPEPVISDALIPRQAQPEIAPVSFLGMPLPLPTALTHRQEKKIDFNQFFGIPGFFKLMFFSLNPMLDIKPLEQPKKEVSNSAINNTSSSGVKTGTVATIPVVNDFNSLPKEQQMAMMIIMAKLAQKNMNGIADKATEAIKPSHPAVTNQSFFSRMHFNPDNFFKQPFNFSSYFSVEPFSEKTPLVTDKSSVETPNAMEEVLEPEPVILFSSAEPVIQNDKPNANCMPTPLSAETSELIVPTKPLSSLTNSVLAVSKGVMPPKSNALDKAQMDDSTVAAHNPGPSTIGRFFGFLSPLRSSANQKSTLSNKGYKKAIFCKKLPEDYLYQDKGHIYLQRDRNRVIAYYHDGKKWIESSKRAREFNKACCFLTDRSETTITQPEKIAQIVDFYVCPSRQTRSFSSFY